MKERLSVAVLDDWLGVADALIDWTTVRAVANLTIFTVRIAPADAASRLAGYDILCLMRDRTTLSAELLADLPRLKLVIPMGRRTPNFDEVAAARMGIAVRPALPGGSDHGGVAGPVELAWALALGLARRIHENDVAVRDGRWQTLLSGELRGKTLGLLGFGRVARAMAPVGAAFGMRCVAYSPSLTTAAARAADVESVGREQLFRDSDVLSIHAALNGQTANSIGAGEFSWMKRTSVLINTARGGIVDETALVAALRSGEIAAAGLDVFRTEPVPATHPILSAPNLLLSPHAGFVTRESLAEAYRGVACQIVAFAA